jgi:hypothetical protein
MRMMTISACSMKRSLLRLRKPRRERKNKASKLSRNARLTSFNLSSFKRKRRREKAKQRPGRKEKPKQRKLNPRRRRVT